MTLRLTPDTLAAAYEYLRTTLPFARWKLPDADEIEFCVTRHRDREADHGVWKGQHCIRVSTHSIGTTDALMQAIAHEQVHAYQDGVLKTGSRRVVHNAEFRRLAARVCRAHGWDKEKFV